MNTRIQKIKTFVQDHKVELAYIAGSAVGFIVTAAIYNAFYKAEMEGRQWDRIDAFENKNTHELILSMHYVNGKSETVTIWPTEQHLKTHTNY